MPTEQPDYLLLGEVLRPHGVLGELRVRIMTDYPERLGELETVYLARDVAGTAARAFRVEKVRRHQGYALMTLRGITNRDHVDPLRGLLVLVSIDDAIPLEDDEIYLYQLIGMIVQTEEGRVLGELTDVIDTGANDVYVVASPEYGEILIPAIDETILKTDTDTNILTVKLLEGLLPD
jgi:16S rRNA processing protein RimM